MSEFKNRKTPGVYITEFDAFPPSIVGVATAVPIFIGYTQTASLDGKPVPFVPVRIQSLADYTAIYGGDAAGFNLPASIELFYENGGGDAFVVSVGDTTGTVDAAALTKGLSAAGEQAGPTLIVIPDAVLLPADASPVGERTIPRSTVYATLVRAMLAQCGARQDRMALLDPYGMDAIDVADKVARQAGIDACAANFRADAGMEFLSYGAAYFPMLVTNKGGKNRLLPPSGAMAGLYTMIDGTRGAWNAPANVVVTGVSSVSVPLTSTEQEPLNAPLDGKAINALRDFVDRGTVVWGARTLDSNSTDWRYIQVRRTVIYIEQSIKEALQPFVFAANDGKTWVAVTGMISNFLQGLWSRGGLMGDKASDAFTVQCGMGSTMTGLDILDGYMIVAVTLQMIHPAEFIELTFKQKMEGVA